MQLHLKLSILAVAAAVTMPPKKKQRTEQPNPPVFPESVVVFAQGDANITETMAERSKVLTDRARGHWDWPCPTHPAHAPACPRYAS